MFATAATKATAAVTVKTRGRLSAEAIQSIRYLVASSVPDLSPEAVSIVDGTGALLARAGDSATMGGSNADERQVEVESRLRDEVEALLAPLVGQGKVRAEVSAEIDRDQTQEQSEVYDPDKQVVARTVTVNNKDNDTETQPAGEGASVGNQLPEAQGKPATPGAAGSQQKIHEDTSEDTTYANSLTRSTVTRGPGKIKRLTVAVMVDGGAKGLPAAQVQRLTRLVENAVGADSERGDSVVIESMAFAADDSLKDEEATFLSKLPMDQIWTFAKLLLIAVVGLVAMRMLRPKPAPVIDGGMLNAGTGTIEGGMPGGAPQLDSEPGSIAQLIAGLDAAALEEEITLAQVDGTVKVGVLKRVGEMVNQSPNEAVAVIRQWMNA
jgi:flagellar M-ring protein FliF